ncbi:ComEC/Rec2 family competence protein [Bacillus suaedae]|uniref:MBL fold metallo-hydrolase n=1 Tax=Halalkalibacter suaedae TaxID=2822140 RepID=A0A940WXL4_9BACI|nr:MBL fold metallo-hydrolase [Bacillus suaedae]MBP3950121.1 MBL fold metallo-hydrolase [Bacillus suaedae]
MKGRSFALLVGCMMMFSVILLIVSDYLDSYTEPNLMTTDSVEVIKNDLFDLTEDQGKLTIRYLYLDAEKKSGDAIVIKTPTGKVVLIDAGIVTTGLQVNDYLDRLQINKIDMAIATHPHYDHIGGYLTLLHEKTVDQLLMPNIDHTTDTYQQFSNLIQEKDVPTKFLYAGDQIILEEGIRIDVISPERKAIALAKEQKLSTTEINNLAFVLKLTYNETTFLFTSDIYKKQEDLLLQTKPNLLRADFLHAPHHGDHTSSSQAFINKVNPQFAVMSSNILQSKKVIKRYKQSDVNVFTTSRIGNVKIESDGVRIKVTPEYVRAYTK